MNTAFAAVRFADSTAKASVMRQRCYLYLPAYRTDRLHVLIGFEFTTSPRGM